MYGRSGIASTTTTATGSRSCSHLVAAGRVHDPGVRADTASLLSDLAMGGPTREAATEVFLRELPSIAEHGAVLILDDFHLVDESPDVRSIVRELVARAPERLSIVFASRRVPSIPLARLRASGEVAEIGTDDLRFDAAETASLFTETYGRALEPDVLADVAAKTEGWAASLQLVQAALRDRTPAQIRQFVRGSERGRPRALRLPRRGGRRRPPGRSPAVPDADVDPSGGDA